MNSESRPAKNRLRFPAISGVFAGLIPGLVALSFDVSHPFWVTVKVVLIVVTFGVAAANLIGLAVVRYRRSSGAADKGSPQS